MKIKNNWILICYNMLDDGTVDVLHIVAFQVEPNEQDMLSIKEELATDQELGMVGVKYEMAKISRLTPAGGYWFKQLNLPDFFEDEDKDGE